VALTRNDKLKRKGGNRPVRRKFLLSTEGVTERKYFDAFGKRYGNEYGIIVRFATVASNKKSDPNNVLKKMKARLAEENIEAKNGDEAWIIVDEDGRGQEKLWPLHEWALASNGRGLALSNPKFEYWILLHFEDGASVSSSECGDRLKKYFPAYEKGDRLDCGKLLGFLDVAVERAKRRDTPRCPDWPKVSGSTVYRLVASMRGERIEA